ncbi:RsmD family RNA methyltransferase [Arenibacter sp. GZD96]|uniref:RsmD family RNA methyltransferase n=1 Tax=Aurantibrevibacter litoralis TaxID=3106030 RepID=UPI002B0006E7|nr:RsmD family RNA methyltransferase [Arenibacter sp. GZD-96]MEA1784917.1 RsmD family RNA methyltransferase [Arenibacter sp. GZD-96]
MRIISGTHKGRRILAPKKLPVRPTTDMAKEALFNILHNRFYFPDLHVLDLCAGTGNISYEFASRGVSKILAVDADPGCVEFIVKTSEALGFSIAVTKSDVFQFLENTEQSFHLIFTDPPYDMALEDFEKIATHVFNHKLLLEDGLLVIEHSKHMNLAHLPHFTQSRKYSNSVFSFFAHA